MTEDIIKKLDEVTTRLSIPEECEDPFCCILLRKSIIDEIRKEFELKQL